jgi:predicted nucleotidyltransferase
VVRKAAPDVLAILRTLREEQVEFIVVGGVCGVLHGAPITTFDLDVVHSREPANLNRLTKALEKLQARYRTPGKEHRAPERSHLSSSGHQLLMTRAGPLDLLGVIGNDRAYEDLLSETEELEIGAGLSVRVLRLAALIKVKEETAAEKDQAVLAILRRTLEEKAKP